MTSPLRILVGVDFSPESRAAVNEQRGDLLRLPSGGLAERIAEHYAEHLGNLTRRGKSDSYRLLRGDPAPGLCREAARGYDLLVMGSRGRGRATTFLLGSTVQEVLHRSPIPVVVVPSRRSV
jgi:nucleotide-binding universal stress UspA family protein